MDDLMHYGVKNMHWGVRRFQYENGGLTPAGKERYATTNSRIDKKQAKKDGKQTSEHEDSKKAHDKKPVSEMSDKELRERLNRINMEQQYKNLNPSKLNKGYKAVKTALAVAGTAIAIKNTYDQIRQWFPVSGVDIDLK